ncbi:NmrA/HSCARG family protein [Arthrobacter sp. MMS18-M83]|uniref:NmrA/HSCARG family protein n=1 Tax=Arthrobacter sp. MMS18-M83 TaxID=2996261 RepID=UPI00227CD25E|nr:NmrA/HSCARG family protein [Arthrobacter sp. MMS18-M83]WAH97456.1 NmrA/HSCARG family protein [Arthrobacter sp. MMS18-M83]
MDRETHFPRTVPSCGIRRGVALEKELAIAVQSPTPTLLTAVFGATGKQGGAVVDALLADGIRVRAVVRDPKSPAARALLARGVEVVRADPADREALTATLLHADAVFGMSTPAGPEGPAGETARGIALAEAVAAAGAPRLVFSTVGGAERHTGIPHFESKRRIEEHIESLGLNATFVRPVFFMENLTQSVPFMGTSIENGTVVVRLPLPESIPIQLVSVRDVGKIAASIMLGADVPGKAVEIAGDERTGRQIAHAIGAHLGLPSRYEAVPIEVLADDEDNAVMFQWYTRLPAHRADFALTRLIDPDVYDLPAWLAATT